MNCLGTTHRQILSLRLCQNERGHKAMREAKRKTEKEAGWCTVWLSGVHTVLCLVHWWLWRIH